MATKMQTQPEFKPLDAYPHLRLVPVLDATVDGRLMMFVAEYHGHKVGLLELEEIDTAYNTAHNRTPRYAPDLPEAGTERALLGRPLALEYDPDALANQQNKGVHLHGLP